MRVCSYCHQLVSESDATCPHDGAPPREAVLGKVPGQVHARFPAVEPFARGNTGSLFLAVQQQSGYRGLLKVLSPELAQSPAERTRLKRELRKQTAITNNALARIIDGGEVGNELWLFRDFVQGESLAIRLRQRGALPVPEALAILAQVASGLDELHRQGLLHRDVKPGHVLLTPRPDAVPVVTLIDAGIAPKLPSQSVFEIVGTPDYLAPEVIAGKPASFRSDLYALGCVMYEMLSGLPPFVADNLEQLLAAQRDVEPRELAVDLPAPVKALLSSLLAKEPRKRPFSAQQVRRALEPYLPPGTPEPSSGTRTLSGNLSAPPAEPGSRAPSRPISEPLARPPSRPISEPLSRSGASPGSRVPSPQLPVPPIVRGAAPGAAPGSRVPSPPSRPNVEPQMTQEIDLTEVEEAWPDQHTEEIDVGELQAASAPSWPRADPTPAPKSVTIKGPGPAPTPEPELEPEPEQDPEPRTAPREPVHDSPTVVQPLAAVQGAVADAEAVMREQREAQRAVEAAVAAAEAGVAQASAEPAAASAAAADDDDLPDDPTILQPMSAWKGPAGQAAPEPEPVVSESGRSPTARKAVDFDVESLFDDDLDAQKKPVITPPVAAASAPAPAPAPAPTFSADEIETDDPFAISPSVPSVAPPSMESPPAPRAPRFMAEAVPPPELHDAAVPDPEGTMVVQRRPPPSAAGKLPLPVIVGSAAAVLFVLFAVFRSCVGHHETASVVVPAPSSAPAPSEPSSGEAKPSTAPSEPSAANGNAQPAPAQPSEPPPSAAGANDNAQPAPTPTQPSEPPPSAAGANDNALPAPSGATATSDKASRRPRPAAVPYHAPTPAEPEVDYKAKARELYAAGKFKEAAAAYEKATQQAPSDAGAFAGLGASWLNANQPDKAILAYQRAVQLKPGISGFQAGLGRAYLQKGDKGRAAAAYRKAVELDPKNSAAQAALQSLGR
jgi:serine/threonine-protein kinase